MSRKSLTSKYDPYSIPSLEEQKEKGSGSYDYDIWLSRIDNALRWRQNYWNGDRNWNRAYDMFRGIHWRDRDNNIDGPASDQLRDRITVNKTQSSILNVVPFLMTTHPEFQGKARQPSKTVSVQLQTAKLNYEYNQRDMNKQVKASVYDSVICGHGICKIGYVFEIDSSKSKADGEIEYASYVTQDHPFVRRVSPFFFLIDPTASENNIETARWVAELYFKTERDILANERYSKTVRNKIKNGTYDLKYRQSTLGANATDQPFLSNLTNQTDDPKLPESQLVMLSEVWDKKYKKYYVFADGVREPLIEKDWPYNYIDNFPYVKLDYVPLPDELYGIGIPYQIEDQQFELNRNRTYAFDHRRRFSARKYEALANLDESELNKLIEGEDGTIIRVPQIGSVSPIPDAPMPQDVQLVEGMINADIQDATGLDALIQGRNLPSRTTSGEVSTRTSLFRLKLDDRVDAVDDFILKIANQVLQHIKANFTQQEAIELLGEQGAYWETLTPEMIKEEVDIFMETVSAPKVDPLLDRQQRLQIWQIATQMLPLIQQGLIKLDLNKLFGWVLESFGIKDIGRFYAPALTPQPPLQEQTVNQQQGQQTAQGQAIQQSAPDFSSLYQQIGGAPITNGSGMQLGAQNG